MKYLSGCIRPELEECPTETVYVVGRVRATGYEWTAATLPRQRAEEMVRQWNAGNTVCEFRIEPKEGA